MIPLKTLRLGNPLFGGSNTIRDVDAEMLFDAEAGVIYVKRRKVPLTEYLVSLATTEHMEPLYKLTVFSSAPYQLGLDELTQIGQKQGKYFAPAQDALDLRTDDQVRFVKINGKVVERKGEKKPDEIEALEYAALEREELSKKVAAAGLPETINKSKVKKPGTVAEMLASAKVDEVDE